MNLSSLKKISLKEMAENSDIIEAKGYEGYLIALYLFDETALKIALKEVDDQSLAVGLIYLDNYEEALESVEEVRRSLLIALISTVPSLISATSASNSLFTNSGRERERRIFGPFGRSFTSTT